MIYLASDHRGYNLKEKIKDWLDQWGYEFQDMGAFEYDPNDDYPDFVHKAAEAVANDPERSRGIILGGSGQGEAMVANRYKNIRAVVYYGPSCVPSSLKTSAYAPSFAEGYGGQSKASADRPGEQGKATEEQGTTDKKDEIIKLSRQHNNSNILSLGASFLSEEEARRAIKEWLEVPFSGDARHIRRLEKLNSLNT